MISLDQTLMGRLRRGVAFAFCGEPHTGEETPQIEDSLRRLFRMQRAIAREVLFRTQQGAHDEIDLLLKLIERLESRKSRIEFGGSFDLGGES
jgi:hypothetical protein